MHWELSIFLACSSNVFSMIRENLTTKDIRHKEEEEEEEEGGGGGY